MGMKTKKNNENLKRYAAQFGMKPWYHQYGWWREHGYNPEIAY